MFPAALNFFNNDVRSAYALCSEIKTVKKPVTSCDARLRPCNQLQSQLGLRPLQALAAMCETNLFYLTSHHWYLSLAVCGPITSWARRPCSRRRTAVHCITTTHTHTIKSTSSMYHYECIALCKDISLQRGRFCARSLASCIPRSSEDRSSRMFFIQVVHGLPRGRLQFFGTEVALQRAEMRMVRWMCGVKLKHRFPSKELRERLGIDDIALVLQQNTLRWYGHVLRKEDDDWVKKCMEYEAEGPRPRGRPKRTWTEVVEKDCQARKLNKEDAMDRSKWRKLIKDVW